MNFPSIQNSNIHTQWQIHNETCSYELHQYGIIHSTRAGTIMIPESKKKTRQKRKKKKKEKKIIIIYILLFAYMISLYVSVSEKHLSPLQLSLTIANSPYMICIGKKTNVWRLTLLLNEYSNNQIENIRTRNVCFRFPFARKILDAHQC